MQTRSAKIVLNGCVVELDDVPPSTTLLDWLRVHRGLTGTKEGCAEGDCGACTVILEDCRHDCIRRRPINSCLTMVGQLDGHGIRTVEGLVQGGKLHPVQQAFAASGGTQCGFCTPGFVMSAFAYVMEGGKAETSLIHGAFAGNLCRCTGYRPIVAAVIDVLTQPIDADSGEKQLEEALQSSRSVCSASFIDRDCEFYAPTTLEEALSLRERFPDAKILAGGTDLNLAISQRREKISRVIYLGKIGEISGVAESATDITIGAAATYETAMKVLVCAFPNLRDYLSRLGSKQIRNLGTIGGNIGTASPIGDFLPVLLALSARIRLKSKETGAREVLADSYFVDYRKTAIRPDELIEGVTIPKLSENDFFFADKISKRRDQDISTVACAVVLRVENGKILHARLAFGGMAPVPKRARLAEAALIGKTISKETFAAAADAISVEFDPVSDWRGSSFYRSAIAKNLLVRTGYRMRDGASYLELDAL